MIKNNSSHNYLVVFMSTLLLLIAVTFYETICDSNMYAYATEADSDSSNSAELYLHKGNSDDNAPFEVENMFPGDSLSQNYCIRVSHSDDVDVKFAVKVKDDSAKLTEAMNIRITVTTTGEVLYEGLIKDIPDEMICSLQTKEETESELCYQIDVWLDTKVGNKYQNKSLTADFNWWIEGTENLEHPKTGDNFPIAMWGIIAGLVLMIGIIVLVSRRRTKEDWDAE